MTIRSLTSLSLMTVLSLGLVACGDDGKPMLTTATTQPSTTNNPSTTNQNTTEPETGTETETAGTDGMTEGTTVSTSTTEPATSTSTTSPATTDDSTTGEPAEGFYGPCGAMGECPVGSACVMLEGLEGTFCAPQCDGMTCPDTGVAGAQGQCVIIEAMGQDPTQCAAICQVANPDCPAGTTCKDVMMMGLGICTAP